jgi:BlaI family transcriptional regulator, penicillinase repressor
MRPPFKRKFFLLEKLTSVSSIAYMSKRKEPLPKISDAEWVIMRAIWNRGKTTANDLFDSIEGAQVWKHKTVSTLLRRLTDKGVLGFEKSGREYVFFPLIEREEAESAQSKSFIENVFGGKPLPFLARFLEAEHLSTEEVETLMRILEDRSL